MNMMRFLLEKIRITKNKRCFFHHFNDLFCILRKIFLDMFHILGTCHFPRKNETLIFKGKMFGKAPVSLESPFKKLGEVEDASKMICKWESKGTSPQCHLKPPRNSGPY